MSKSCSCESCKQRCQTAPGWFKPGEVEKTAKFLKISLRELFKRYLSVDFWMADGIDIEEDVFVLSPATIDGSQGQVFSADNRYGQCVFFQNGQCVIHAVKPFECKAVDHNTSRQRGQILHEGVAKKWNKKDYQKQIEKLLGEKPEIPEDISDSSSFGYY